VTTLRVVAYNVNSAAPGQAQAIGDVLAALEPDVVALTEADNAQSVAELARRVGWNHVWERGSGTRHIATLSRYPILTSRIYNRPPLTQAALATTLDVGGLVITIYNVHFLPFLLLPFELRRWQAAGRLLKVIGDRPAEPHLIVGDLNAIGPGDKVLQRQNPARMRRLMALQLFVVFRLAVPRLLRAGYVDCFRRLHPADHGFTWWTIRPTTRYDYILANPAMAAGLRQCRLGDDAPGVVAASDHFPLLADFDLNLVATRPMPSGSSHE
jgi:exonuclease III